MPEIIHSGSQGLARAPCLHYWQRSSVGVRRPTTSRLAPPPAGHSLGRPLRSQPARRMEKKGAVVAFRAASAPSFPRIGRLAVRRQKIRTSPIARELRLQTWALPPGRHHEREREHELGLVQETEERGEVFGRQEA